jgi:hypothetical protein
MNSAAQYVVIASPQAAANGSQSRSARQRADAPLRPPMKARARLQPAVMPRSTVDSTCVDPTYGPSEERPKPSDVKPARASNGSGQARASARSGFSFALRKRLRARAATFSRFLGAADVSSTAIKALERAVISSTARVNASSLAAEGLLKPLIFRTNCRAALLISASVEGGSKLNSGRMLRHIGSSPILTGQHLGYERHLRRRSAFATRLRLPCPTNFERTARSANTLR